MIWYGGRASTSLTSGAPFASGIGSCSSQAGNTMPDFGSPHDDVVLKSNDTCRVMARKPARFITTGGWPGTVIVLPLTPCMNVSVRP